MVANTLTDFDAFAASLEPILSHEYSIYISRLHVDCTQGASGPTSLLVAVVIWMCVSIARGSQPHRCISRCVGGCR